MNIKVLIVAGLFQACDVPVISPAQSGATGHGLVVAATDLNQSANIGLMSTTGEILSPSIISTGSHEPGLTTSLGGDLAFPSLPTLGNEIVILDRYPRSVLTWLNINTPNVRAQLSVATGFLADPHDYVPITPNKAYVPRFDSNSNAGREPFDRGGDLLIVDPSVPSIVGRIDIAGALPKQANFVVHPDRARLVQDRVYVVLPYYDSAFNSGQSYVAAVDPKSDAITDSVLLGGLSGCSGLDAAPDQNSLAVVCSGRWYGTNNANISASAIVGLQIRPKLAEAWRISAASVGRRAFSFNVGFVDATHVLASQMGDLGPPVINDVAYVIDFHSGESTAVLQSANVPFTLSAGPCNNFGLCFIADAQRKSVHRLDFTDAQQWTLSDFSWNDPTGLPPQMLALF